MNFFNSLIEYAKIKFLMIRGELLCIVEVKYGRSIPEPQLTFFGLTI